MTLTAVELDELAVLLFSDDELELLTMVELDELLWDDDDELSRSNVNSTKNVVPGYLLLKNRSNVCESRIQS